MNDLTIEEIENDVWGEPTFGSYIVTQSHLLRKVPLKNLTDENLRLLIGQKLSLEIVVPLTLEMLANNHWLGGNMCDSTLLLNVLKIPETYWEKHLDDFNTLSYIISAMKDQLDTFNNEILPTYTKLSE